MLGYPGGTKVLPKVLLYGLKCSIAVQHGTCEASNHQYHENKARGLMMKEGRRLIRGGEESARADTETGSCEWNMTSHCSAEDGRRDYVPENAGSFWKLEKKATYRTAL